MTETLVFRQRRWKMALVLFGAVVFVALGIFMIVGPVAESSRHSPEFVHLIGWSCVLFFGLCGLAGVAGLMKPSELTLTSEGFQVTGLKSRPMVAWRDVDRFFIVQVRSTKIVAYELRPESKSALARLSGARGFGWGDGAIPGQMESSPIQMLAVLEEWLRRHAD